MSSGREGEVTHLSRMCNVLHKVQTTCCGCLTCRSYFVDAVNGGQSHFVCLRNEDIQFLDFGGLEEQVWRTIGICAYQKCLYDARRIFLFNLRMLSRLKRHCTDSTLTQYAQGTRRRLFNAKFPVTGTNIPLGDRGEGRNAQMNASLRRWPEGSELRAKADKLTAEAKRNSARKHVPHGVKVECLVQPTSTASGQKEQPIARASSWH